MNTFKYITLGFAASLLVTSCDLNEDPTFSDSKAFAAFKSASVSVSEDAVKPAVLTISLASVAGKVGTVDISVVNDETYSAKEGVDFSINSKSVKFDAEHRVATVEVSPIPNGVYTGDMKVKFVLSSSDVNLGAEKECVLTIYDVEHPLASILHTYTATNADGSWEVTLSKDPDDTEKVWIDNLDDYFAANGFSGHIYGVVNSEDGVLKSITVPTNQFYNYKHSTYGDVYFLVFSTPTVDDPDAVLLTETGNMTILIEEDGHKLVLQNAFGTYVSAGYFNRNDAFTMTY